jgi:hypothetical protein
MLFRNCQPPGILLLGGASVHDGNACLETAGVPAGRAGTPVHHRYGVITAE